MVVSLEINYVRKELCNKSEVKVQQKCSVRAMVAKVGNSI